MSFVESDIASTGFAADIAADSRSLDTVGGSGLDTGIDSAADCAAESAEAAAAAASAAACWAAVFCACALLRATPFA